VNGTYLASGALAAALLLSACEAPHGPQLAAGQVERPARATQTMAVLAQPGAERFPEAAPNVVKAVADHPVSTFGADVDTASYAVLRRMLREGRRPPEQAVRIEEMVNYFPYGHDAQGGDGAPFRSFVAVAPTPWNPDTRLLHIAVATPRADKPWPPANLVFLVDVSGSMQPPDRLPLVKDALRMLVDRLRAEDRISIVTYAEGVRVALEPTPGDDKTRILGAVDGLRAGGGTNGADGLQAAYRLAEQSRRKDGVNRVVLATDGDFNVGVTDPKQLQAFIAEKRRSGVYLSVLGVGLGNLNDALMQRLAQSGNGVAAYLDSLMEARKVLVEQLRSGVEPVADDVKLQVEFNPRRISEYRLLGYETRALTRQDFADEAADAGEIGGGHAVTAIYEVTPVGSPAQLTEPLRYGASRPEATPAPGREEELAFLRIRYKRPGGQKSELVERPITSADEAPTLAAASDDVRFAFAVAAFGQYLRRDPWLRDYGLGDIEALAQAARGGDEGGWRAEFVQLVRLASALR